MDAVALCIICILFILYVNHVKKCPNKSSPQPESKPEAVHVCRSKAPPSLNCGTARYQYINSTSAVPDIKYVVSEDLLTRQTHHDGLDELETDLKVANVVGYLKEGFKKKRRPKFSGRTDLAKFDVSTKKLSDLEGAIQNIDATRGYQGNVKFADTEHTRLIALKSPYMAYTEKGMRGAQHYFQVNKKYKLVEQTPGNQKWYYKSLDFKPQENVMFYIVYSDNKFEKFFKRSMELVDLKKYLTEQKIYPDDIRLSFMIGVQVLDKVSYENEIHENRNKKQIAFDDCLLEAKLTGLTGAEIKNKCYD